MLFAEIVWIGLFGAFLVFGALVGWVLSLTQGPRGQKGPVEPVDFNSKENKVLLAA